MFAAQHHVDAVDTGRKRFREDEEAAIAASSFGEHRNKRFQTLPLRSSPRAHQQSISSSVEPLNASPAISRPLHHIVDWSACNLANTPPQQQDVEGDMMDTTMISPPPSAEYTAQPSAFHADFSTGRMPTPIQTSFAAQVKGQQGDWADGQMAMTPNGVANLGHKVTGISQEQGVPRGLNAKADWQMLQNTRRLPSPISEAGDGGQSGMMVDDDEDMAQHVSSHSQCSSPGNPSPTQAMEHPNAIMDVNNRMASLHHYDSEADPSSPSPGRKGHQRSKHTVNSWTWQPGMKKSFSIGYRSDCEKCRLKVPGHFNHIVIS